MKANLLDYLEWLYQTDGTSSDPADFYAWLQRQEDEAEPKEFLTEVSTRTETDIPCMVDNIIGDFLVEYSDPNESAIPSKEDVDILNGLKDLANKF